MRIFYLVGSLIFTVLILILAFENIQSICTYITIFFTELPTDAPPTFLIFGISVLGVFTGFCYHGLIASFFNSDDEEDDDM
jgi:uncharacterized integral membrane protein